MRFAIATDGEFVSPHFGRCSAYTIVDIEDNKVVDIEDNKVIKKEVLNNPGHSPGFLPEFLHQKGVNCIICGGIGQRAISFLKQYGIEVILGIEGKINDVIEKLIEGKLVSGESLCNQKAGKNCGIEKKECEHKGGD